MSREIFTQQFCRETQINSFWIPCAQQALFHTILPPDPTILHDFASMHSDCLQHSWYVIPYWWGANVYNYCKSMICTYMCGSLGMYM